MARLSISFLSVFLVLAALALSMPVKRGEDAAPGLGLDSALGPLSGATKLVPGLSQDDGKPKLSAEEKKKQEEEQEEQQKKDDNAAIAKANHKIAESNGDVKPTPTASTKSKLSSGNFVTPTATPTHKPQSKPNELSKIPIVGGLLGGAGAGI
ncbi:hypothetical protein N7541_006132 [Penicillium brevicompactum]|uniref:Uncharacterized protein n=1 Tax=Penicillium brevicompactum TaxID=5074 RepID=A0A9W9R4I8_PENBR|nr:uncharacterized protein N7506_012202 [Penicillium brevicompactum]KAJ5319498.1 hypothetical protein N7506_012202 [Penicillium brevicompactum]KAJ5353568.1 hypothetical protein N7541_006132 [Penicillium brevicompactum]